MTILTYVGIYTGITAVQNVVIVLILLDIILSVFDLIYRRRLER